MRWSGEGGHGFRGLELEEIRGGREERVSERGFDDLFLFFSFEKMGFRSGLCCCWEREMCIGRGLQCLQKVLNYELEKMLKL